MTDTLTIGTLVAEVLSAGAAEAGKAALGAATTDAYGALKSKLTLWFGSDATALEANPTSQARKAVLAEIVDDRSQAETKELLILAQALRTALDSEGRAQPLNQIFNQFNNTGSGNQYIAQGGPMNIGSDAFTKKSLD